MQPQAHPAHTSEQSLKEPAVSSKSIGTENDEASFLMLLGTHCRTAQHGHAELADSLCVSLYKVKGASRHSWKQKLQSQSEKSKIVPCIWMFSSNDPMIQSNLGFNDAGSAAGSSNLPRLRRRSEPTGSINCNVSTATGSQDTSQTSP